VTRAGRARAISKSPGVARKGKIDGRRAGRTSPELAAVCSLPYRLAHVIAQGCLREPVEPTSFLFSYHGEVSARRGHCGGVDLPERVRVERLLSDERRLVYAAPRGEPGTLLSQPDRCRTSRPNQWQPRWVSTAGRAGTIRPIACLCSQPEFHRRKRRRAIYRWPLATRDSLNTELESRRTFKSTAFYRSEQILADYTPSPPCDSVQTRQASWRSVAWVAFGRSTVSTSNTRNAAGAYIQSRSLALVAVVLTLGACSVLQPKPAVEISAADVNFNTRWHARIASPAELAGVVQNERIGFH